MSQQMKQAKITVEQIISKTTDLKRKQQLQTIDKLIALNLDKIWLRTKSGKPMAEKIETVSNTALERLDSESFDLLESVAKEIDEEVERRQIERTQKIRKDRDNKKVDAALDGLRKASEGEENVMPHIVDAVREYATIGEIFEVWRELWGEWDEPKIF